MVYRYVKNRKLSEIVRDRETIRRITVQPSRKLPATFKQESTKMISPPPAYSTAIKTIFNTQNSVTEDKANVESYRTFNGRTYAVVKVFLI